METKHGQAIALGNHLKRLRQKHHLTIAGLADLLGISHSYVGFIENGSRNASEKILKKYADFFQVSYAELAELQLQLEYPTQIENPLTLTDEMMELNSLLMKLNEDFRSSIIEDFKEQIQQTLYNLLTPYNIADIKKYITKIKNAWFSECEEPLIEIKNYKGYIALSSEQLYFELYVEHSVLHVQLLYCDRKQRTLFENWLGDCSISYQTEENLQHISEPQKILNILWLSPNMSYRQQYQYLVTKELLSLELNYCDAKLNWFVHNYDKHNAMQDIQENIS
ncbi:helix-turn-helix domain-containing protein [Lysinibacillus sp. CD3-6]|uniref:helix-turn-helix domain-containing protein n=1 Tax=Lysinibacillus sp. CD3-6 TaxID=2892541 RepID=UPI00116CB79C|nr:helix-turn-helix transcriptional regulator [Lysinibacillus sp. CD3-6]UED80860.1 helix-turn-helix domain-containing protein [Lysinibacillus sp. CD3-6]